MASVVNGFQGGLVWANYRRFCGEGLALISGGMIIQLRQQYIVFASIVSKLEDACQYLQFQTSKDLKFISQLFKHDQNYKIIAGIYNTKPTGWYVMVYHIQGSLKKRGRVNNGPASLGM